VAVLLSYFTSGVSHHGSPSDQGFCAELDTRHPSCTSPSRTTTATCRDAAKAYKEFEDFFAGDDAASAPRGGTRGPAHGGGRGGVGGGFVKAGGGESMIASLADVNSGTSS
jgi:hypothetical protein